MTRSSTPDSTPAPMATAVPGAATAGGTAGRTTAQWQQADAAHFLHPFTDFQGLARKGARIITRADNIYLWDSDGQRILDAMSGLWCVNVGYGQQALVQAATRQMQELPFYNAFFQTATVPAIELAELLAEVAPPGFEHVFFSGSGSEGNDTIVRMVRRYWDVLGQPQRQVIISRHNAYHGSTMAGASLGGMAGMHAQGGLPIPGITHIQQPCWWTQGRPLGLEPEAFGRQAAQWLEQRILELGPENVAAFIGEPVQGAGGVIIPPASYWPEIQRICERHGILLVSDEVICGFGRTGKLGVFAHGFTYSGHPVACAVANKTLEIYQRIDIVGHVRRVAPVFQMRLQALADHPLVGEARGVGLIGGLELVKDKRTKESFDSRRRKV